MVTKKRRKMNLKGLLLVITYDTTVEYNGLLWGVLSMTLNIWLYSDDGLLYNYFS